MMKQAVQRRGERGIVLFLGVLSLAMIIPMVGVSVDVGYLYASKARLQAAVDGASLAAARALNLGTSTSAQATSAKQNAVNWFYSNFPPGNWATSNTVMTTSNVQVYDDTINPNLRHVDVTATTRVPTYFMKWLHFNSTTISALGFASRRDAVVMLVLDRSGSMCSGASQPCTGGACASMKSAAKIFTGQFAAGRDYIGLVSFSDATFIHSPPVQSFRTTLGYTDGTTSGSGAIDTIQCAGGTNTAQAMSMGYNALYQRYLPGAFNVLVLETDGLPNTLTVNMWDGTAFGMASRSTTTTGKNPVTTSRGCKDNSSKNKYDGGWRNSTIADARVWTSGFSMNTITTNTPHVGFISNIPSGSIGTIYSPDPATSPKYFNLVGQYIDTSGNSGLDQISTSTTLNCLWGTSQADTVAEMEDFLWLPAADVTGNSMKPALNPYKNSVILNGTGRIKFNSTAVTGTTNNTAMTITQMWQNYHDAALNATDHAGYRARTNANIPATVFVIGLGGQGSDPTDHTLLQRIANDPRGDSSVPYVACASNASCVNYSAQPQGTYIYSSNSNVLKAKFLELSSQILRLSQ
ncbi:MAG: VWA domain-containing protein [Bryobacteraceae bacterium]